MRRLPKLMETWVDGNTTIEIYEDVQTMASCELTCYKLRIIVDDSEKFPVLSGAMNEAKKILNRKNHRELYKIGTDFQLSGKNETDQ
tara:strand:+ start:174 stop:434 length:261 start_codon:yes stop_codon:yes gene_type:complete